jgi:hypothetical protein
MSVTIARIVTGSLQRQQLAFPVMARCIEQHQPQQPQTKIRISKASKRKHGGDKADRLAHDMLEVLERHLTDVIRHDHVQAFELILRNRVGVRLHGSIDDARLVELLVKHNAYKSMRKLCPFDKYNQGDHLMELPLDLLMNPNHHPIIAYFLYNRNLNVLRCEMIEGKQRRVPVVHFRIFSLLVLVGSTRAASIDQRITFFKVMVQSCDFIGPRSLVQSDVDVLRDMTQQRFLSTLLDTIQRDEMPYNHQGFSASYTRNPIHTDERKLFTRALLETLSDEALEAVIAYERPGQQQQQQQQNHMNQSDDNDSEPEDSASSSSDLSAVSTKSLDEDDVTWTVPRTCLSQWAFRASEVLSSRMGPIGTEVARSVTVLPAVLVHLICGLLSDDISHAVHPPAFIAKMASFTVAPAPTIAIARKQYLGDETETDSEEEDEEDKPILSLAKRARTGV